MDHTADAMFVMSLKESVRWIFFNIGVALFPIWATQIVTATFGTVQPLSKVLKDGELFVFSSTLSASAMGTAFFERDVGLAGIMLTACGLIVVLIISGGLFFATVQLKSTGQQVPNEKRLAKASIYCAIAAAFLSYVVQAAGSVQ